MREHLTQYVQLLFTGTEGCEEIQQEILLNTLDRYDDLIAEGKVPEAAYRMAIAGIGDISEILGSSACQSPALPPENMQAASAEKKKKYTALAVGLYILCPIPLILLAELDLEILGVCMLLAMVAIATMLLILNGKEHREEENEEPPYQSELHRSIHRVILTGGLVSYFAVSFLTGAWHITWLIFPITGAVKGLAWAILDLKEAIKNET